MEEKVHMLKNFRKKISPQVGLEPTKMRQDLKKSVSILPEGEEKILSFGYDFSENFGLHYYLPPQISRLCCTPEINL